MQNILVPTDFSSEAHNALEVALQLARRTGGRITLLHVVDAPPTGGIVTTGGAIPGASRQGVFMVQLLAHTKRRMHQLMDETAATAPGVPVQDRIATGPLHEAVLDVLREQPFDLVVVGAREHKPVWHLFTPDSLAEHLVRAAPCPVLTVKHPAPHFAELGPPSPGVYARWFGEVCRRTAVMIAHWQSVGFVHGVMNTDNMSILGLTIDYGPYGWLEPYDPDWTPNTTDFGSRRYAYGQQPNVGLWNLWQLARSLAHLVEDPELLRPGLDLYSATFEATRHAMLLRKLGLTNLAPEEDKALFEALHEALAGSEVDMTLFFRHLSHAAPALLRNADNAEATWEDLLAVAAYSVAPAEEQSLRQWLSLYLVRLRQETAAPEAIRETMLSANPKYVLRNYLAQQAIEAAEAGDLSVLSRLMQVLKTPFAEQPEHEELAAKRPDWAREKPGCATLSCSS